MNVDAILQTIRNLMALRPAIEAAVHMAEDMLPNGGKGAEKLQATLAILQAAFSTVEGVTQTYEQLKPAIAGMIGVIVSAYNTMGVFKKSAK
jgi:hypothetical protein